MSETWALSVLSTARTKWRGVAAVLSWVVVSAGVHLIFVFLEWCFLGWDAVLDNNGRLGTLEYYSGYLCFF